MLERTGNSYGILRNLVKGVATQVTGPENMDELQELSSILIHKYAKHSHTSKYASAAAVLAS